MTRKVTLLDGGFSTQLVSYTGEVIDGDPLWTSRFLVTDQEKCIFTHRDYVKAGANIISTGSYQSSVEGYKTYLGLDREAALGVIKDSVYLAKQGIELAYKEAGARRDVLVAGSVGPYGACLHDGSEYTGSYTDKVTIEFLMEWHRPRVEALIEAGCDLLALETLPCSKEAIALITLVNQFPNIKYWISFSVRDTSRISNGELFAESAVKCWETAGDRLIAVGVNCLHPSLVSPLYRKLKQSRPDIPFIAYPNSGETYDAQSGRWVDQENSVHVTGYLEEWLNLGVSFIGGCCRTNAKDIEQFSQDIKQWQLKNA